MITGYGTTEGKAHCTYAKSVEPAMRLEFNSMINFKATKPAQSCLFGLNLSVGMM